MRSTTASSPACPWVGLKCTVAQQDRDVPLLTVSSRVLWGISWLACALPEEVWALAESRRVGNPIAYAKVATLACQGGAAAARHVSWGSWYRESSGRAHLGGC